MLLPVKFIFDSQWTAPSYVCQLLTMESDFRITRDQKDSGFISCATPLHSAEESLRFAEMAGKAQLQHVG
jgi:putative IMPACT (imprinted ancient) family translation regulator